MPVFQYPQPQTGSGNWVRATSPTLVTPVLGVAGATSLALNGATIGTDALAVTGTATLNGSLTIAGGTVTVSTPLISATQTWNAGGVTFTGLKANFTDTASASASLLMDLQVGSASKFSVSKAGLVTLGGGLTANGDVKAGNGNAFVFGTGPLILNVGGGMNFRNAGNSAYVPVRGKITVDNAYTAGAVVGTGYITIYDSSDTAYRVPCLV